MCVCDRKQFDLASHENPPTTVNLFGYLLTVSRQLSFLRLKLSA